MLRGDRIVVPQALQREMIKLAHRGHQGATSIKAHMRSKVWFPAMDKKIEDELKYCKACAMVALPDKPHPMSRRVPSEPFSDLAVDFKEGLPNMESLLVVSCIATRCIFTETMKNPTSGLVCAMFLKLFSQYGLPRTITADNGPQFRSIEFRRFCQSFGIDLNNSTPYWPERNGAIERQNRNIGRRIEISLIEGTDWRQDLAEYLLMYHCTPQDSTGLSPGEMMFGRPLRGFIPSVEWCQSAAVEGANERDILKKFKAGEKANIDRNAQETKMKPGDIVLKKNLNKRALDPNFTAEEHEVTQVNGSEIRITSKDTGKEYLRNCTHLKKLEKRGEGVEGEKQREDQRKVVIQTEQECRPKRTIKIPARYRDA